MIIQSQWETGYCADVTIQNGTGQRIDGWSVVVDLNGAGLDSIWNATASQSGDQFAATDVGWNGTVQAGQSLAVFGYCAATTASSGSPVVVSVVER